MLLLVPPPQMTVSTSMYLSQCNNCHRIATANAVANAGASGSSKLKGETCQTEMEKRVDTADISVLFFSSAVLIFWLLTRKQTINTVLFWTVLKAIS